MAVARYYYFDVRAEDSDFIDDIEEQEREFRRLYSRLQNIRVVDVEGLQTRIRVRTDATRHLRRLRRAWYAVELAATRAAASVVAEAATGLAPVRQRGRSRGLRYSHRVRTHRRAAGRPAASYVQAQRPYAIPVIFGHRAIDIGGEEIFIDPQPYVSQAATLTIGAAAAAAERAAQSVIRHAIASATRT